MSLAPSAHGFPSTPFRFSEARVLPRYGIMRFRAPPTICLACLRRSCRYDSAKKAIVVYTGDNLLCHLCSAVCSGFVASLCSTPADVAKSRIMAQTALPDGTMPYNGTFDCWRKVVANEGPLALYKGFMPGWLRLGPWQLVFWCSYEQLRLLSGLGGFK